MLDRYFGCVIVLLFAACSMFGQTASDPLRAGELPASSERSGQEKPSLLLTGLEISNEFDDNALSGLGAKQNNVVTVIEPHVSWIISQPRIKWTLGYRPGLSMSHEVPIYNSRSHLLGSELQSRLTKRLTVELRGSFLETRNPFHRLRSPEFLPDFGLLDRPNEVVPDSRARTTSKQAGLGLTYVLGRHSTVGASGSFFELKQRLLSETPSLQQRLGDTRSTSGHAFYTHHVTRRQWIGLEYNVQKLISRSAQSDTVAHSAFFTHIISLTPKTRFTVFAGPEHSATYYRFGIPAPAAQVAASRSTWRWAGGATYEWTGTHTSFSASLSRRISDGAGFFGAVRLSGATAELRRELTRRWRADLLISYQLNRPLVGSQGALTYISASGGLTRALSHNLSLDLRYWRVNQSASGALTGIGLSNHHRVSASLAYAFARPLGS